MELMQEDINIILSILFACLLLYLLVKILIKPLLYLTKIFYKVAAGFFILIFVNFTLGVLFQFQLGINLITATIAGILGAPGVVLIYGVKSLLG
ncbi:SigmaK-factor processing regulatory protein BofA [Natranaerofaba carboxydovora]|nr:SigmaK-factor processing regulatory protein BofA [Natranaerofaba carboxydovora]